MRYHFLFSALISFCCTIPCSAQTRAEILDAQVKAEHEAWKRNSDSMISCNHRLDSMITAAGTDYGKLRRLLPMSDQCLKIRPSISGYLNRARIKNRMSRSGGLEDYCSAVAMQEYMVAIYEDGAHEEGPDDDIALQHSEKALAALYFERAEAFDNFGAPKLAAADRKRAAALDPDNPKYKK